MDKKIKGNYMLPENNKVKIYDQETMARIASNVEIGVPLEEAELIFTGWGAPHMDKEFLDKAPNLKMVFYGAGSIRHVYSDEFWKRGIRITSSYGANAIPVAEYTVSQIIFSLKHGWKYMRSYKNAKEFHSKRVVPGVYKTTVGIVSLGMIGQLVANMLKSYDVKVIAFDPFANKEKADELGVELVSLEELFKRSDCVSLHTPWLPETVGMINGKLFSSMKEGATFINTSRGAVVNEEEMIPVLQKRKDLMAVLDVTWPEPPVEDSPFYTLENVVLTPHLAGSMNKECNRMGEYMAEELDLYLAGEKLKWEIDEERAKVLA